MLFCYDEGMKLFLASQALGGKLSDYFTELVGKKTKDIQIALIENAGDTYTEEKKAWVYENRATFTDAGYQVELVDLRDYKGKPEQLEAKLTEKDAVWLNGGNTFYLNWLLHEVEANIIIPKLVRQGIVYGGGSAGAIVASPTLKYIDAADEPDDAPEIIWEGMKMVDVAVVPHIGNEKYGKIMDDVVSSLKNDGYEVVGLTDGQAAIFDKGKCKIVNSI